MQSAGRRVVSGALLVTIVVVGGWWCAPSVAQESKLPSAEKILDMTIKAQGGREAFEKLTSSVSKGTLELAMAGQSAVSGTIETYRAAPNLRYTIVDLGQQGKIEIGCDGFTSWQLHTPGGPIVHDGDEKIERLRNATFNLQLNWRDYYPQVECLGKANVDGQSCYAVTLRPAVGRPLTKFFDRKRGLPIKEETTAANDSGELFIWEAMKDYRKVDGVQLPHLIERHVSGAGRPDQTITTVWQSIEHNTTIPPEKFVLPDAVKEARDKQRAEKK